MLDRSGSNGRQDLAVEASSVDVAVHGVEKVVHSPVGFGDIVDEIVAE